MDEQTPIESAMLEASPAVYAKPAPPLPLAPAEDASRAPMQELPESDPTRSPTTRWRPWTALLALFGGLVLATVGGLVVDLVASLLFGVSLTGSRTPPGLIIAGTVVQDLGFVLAAVYCAQIGGNVVRSWQLGLRRPGVGWAPAAGFVALLLVVFVVLSVIWAQLFHPETEKLLETLGTNEGTLLLVLSAGLTCVVAPICEELLFRGYLFTALRNWRGTLTAAAITGILFGGVHVGSAPALDLVPLAGLGFGLCLLYRYTGSLYPCIVAHLLNNTVAFTSLEGWNLFSWRPVVLVLASLAALAALIALFKRVGAIAPAPRSNPIEA